MKELNENEIKDILYLFDIGIRISDIRKKYSCRYTTVRDVIRDSGRVITKGLSKNRCINESYFDDIDTDRKAYLLGMLFTDGSVVNDTDGLRAPMIKLEISDTDIEVLYLLKDELNCESSISFNKRKNKNGTCCVGFRSKQISESLSKYGIVPNKTYITNHLPYIPNDYIPSFIHGMIDGDGSIYYSKNQWHVNFCSHSKSICEEFYSMCAALINKDTPQTVQCSDGVYRITFNGKYAKLLLNKFAIEFNYGIARKRIKAVSALEDKKDEDIV